MWYRHGPTARQDHYLIIRRSSAETAAKFEAQIPKCARTSCVPSVTIVIHFSVVFGTSKLLISMV